MLDILLDFLAYLGIRSLKKKRRENAESPSSETGEPQQDQGLSQSANQQGASVCAGCNSPVDKGAIYELGKTWCVDCYKSHVLKIQE